MVSGKVLGECAGGEFAGKCRPNVRGGGGGRVYGEREEINPKSRNGVKTR